MRLLNLHRWVRRLFQGRQPPTVVQPPIPEEPEFADNLPPGFIPIETQVFGQHIDGTGRWIGLDARVGQMPSGELITCERTRGVRCGCGHIIYAVQEIVTQTGIHAGIGGICQDCAAEAESLVARGAISASQAEALGLYCTQCASHCDNCGRYNLCTRHTRLFQEADGRQQPLCPECLKKARGKRLFEQTLTTLARLFAEEEPSPLKQGGPYHGG